MRNISEESKEKIKLGALKGIESQKRKRLDEYNKFLKYCLECENVLPYKKRHNKFCNHSCSADFNNREKGKIVNPKSSVCRYCEQAISGRKKYCNSKCQNEYEYIEYIKKWLSNDFSGVRGKYDISRYVKRYIFEKFDNKCVKCGWNKINLKTNKTPLHIHHIDGCYKNCSEDNLILLCPNCHSLTDNYGSLNKGNGREYNIL